MLYQLRRATRAALLAEREAEAAEAEAMSKRPNARTVRRHYNLANQYTASAKEAAAVSQAWARGQSSVVKAIADASLAEATDAAVSLRVNERHAYPEDLNHPPLSPNGARNGN